MAGGTNYWTEKDGKAHSDKESGSEVRGRQDQIWPWLDLAGPFGPKWGKTQLARALHKLSLFFWNLRYISFTRRTNPESVWKVT